MLIKAILSLVGEQNTHADDALWSISGWSAATGGDPRSLEPSVKPVQPHYAEAVPVQVDAIRKRAA